MKDHILEFISPGIKLKKMRGLLVVQSATNKTEVPFADIAGVLIISEDILISSAVISELLNHGVVIQVLNNKYMPHGMLIPYVGHRMMRERLLAQLALSEAQIQRFWQKLVIQKIKNQAKALEQLGLNNEILKKFQMEVESGDPKNHEAQAARVYWQSLFGDEFRRDVDRGGLNSFLNYGYAVIRSAVARYVVACGLHPSLGLFHTNLENPFCLVDDLMEPFRPLIDFICYDFKEVYEMNPVIKKELVRVLDFEVKLGDEVKPLKNAIAEYCQCFTKAVLAKDYRLFNTEVELYYGKSRRV